MTKNKLVDPETLPYRPCVGVMVLNSEGLVWVGHRIAEPDSEFSGTTQLWQMPQGGIDKGEEPLVAARREIYEETGMKSLDLLAEAPDWINYDLPRDLVGIASRDAIAARRRNGSHSASAATKAKSRSIHLLAAMTRSSTIGDGSR